uniref:NADH-ubiquinone oxidoreductase chain 2 n=1 Tax=Phoeniculus purpureus TaxID=113189 RepID=A0A3G2LKM5_PHOPU|nr:NADH dehydrogenase subunit 2 [Phoeniculus purpureus]
MAPITKLVTYSSLMLGTTITITSSHWATAWAGLEINTLAVVPLISKSHHPRAVEATIKYFLVQATASTMLLFSSMINAWATGQWDIALMSHPTASLLLTVAIAMKLGLAPFHFWLPEVLQGSSLITALLLSTVVKLPPISILSQTTNSMNPTLLTVMAILSAAIGGWMGLNQTQIRKVLAFSSMSHLGWMTIVVVYSPKLALLTFYLYTLTTSATFLLLRTTRALKLTTLMTSWTKSPTLSATLMLSLLSLAGLPPLTGFLPKWLIIQELTKQEVTTAATTIAMLSLLGLFFYLRLAYHSTITLPPNTSNHMKQWHPIPAKTNTGLTALVTLSALLLPLSPTVMALP